MNWIERNFYELMDMMKQKKEWTEFCPLNVNAPQCQLFRGLLLFKGSDPKANMLNRFWLLDTAAKNSPTSEKLRFKTKTKRLF